MKRLRVTSNHVRSNTTVLGNGKLVLHFDDKGEATMPAHLLPILKAEMRSRPGRYRIVGEERKPQMREDPEVRESLRDLLDKYKQDLEEGLSKTLVEEQRPLPLAIKLLDSDKPEKVEEPKEVVEDKPAQKKAPKKKAAKKKKKSRKKVSKSTENE